LEGQIASHHCEEQKLPEKRLAGKSLQDWHLPKHDLIQHQDIIIIIIIIIIKQKLKAQINRKMSQMFRDDTATGKQ